MSAIGEFIRPGGPKVAPHQLRSGQRLRGSAFHAALAAAQDTFQAECSHEAGNALFRTRAHHGRAPA